jgi:LmbE family N-acetylglucosaminyl deacetylase
VVSFDAQDPGTSRREWEQDARLSTLAPVELDPARTLVVLAAHPDDETLGAGGLIASALAAGVAVTVVVVTDGSASHDAALVDGATLAELRAVELESALRRLGAGTPPPALHLLGYRDGTVREERAAVEAELTVLLAALPDAVIVAPWRGDGHRDHRVLGKIAAELAAARGVPLWEYPIWLWHWGHPQDPAVPWSTLRAFPLSPAARRAKAEALAAFESQTTPRGDEPPLLHARFLEHFARPDEVFVVDGLGHR